MIQFLHYHVITVIFLTISANTFAFQTHVFHSRSEHWGVLHERIIQDQMTGLKAVQFATDLVTQQCVEKVSFHSILIITFFRLESQQTLPYFDLIEFLSSDVFWFVYQDVPCPACTGIYLSTSMIQLIKQHTQVISLIMKILDRLSEDTNINVLVKGLGIFMKSTMKDPKLIYTCEICGMESGISLDINIWKFAEIRYDLKNHHWITVCLNFFCDHSLLHYPHLFVSMISMCCWYPVQENRWIFFHFVTDLVVQCCRKGLSVLIIVQSSFEM